MEFTLALILFDSIYNFRVYPSMTPLVRSFSGGKKRKKEDSIAIMLRNNCALHLHVEAVRHQ